MSFWRAELLKVVARLKGLEGELEDLQPLNANLTSWAGVTRAAGLDAFAATPSSANLAALLADETGTGAAVFANAPTLVAPVLGAAAATSINFGGSTLNTYTEQTWTPILTASGVNFTSVTYNASRFGAYTRIGRAVHAYGLMITDAVTVGGATGSVLIAGLPFTAASPTAGSVAFSSAWTTNNPNGIIVFNGVTLINVYMKTTANGASSQLPVASVATGASSNQMYFSVIYNV